MVFLMVSPRLKNVFNSPPHDDSGPAVYLEL